MKQVLKSYGVILLHLAMGLVVLLSIEKLKLPTWLNASAFTLIVFIVINVVDDIVFKLKEGLKTYWSVRKLHYLFIGILAGSIIRAMPELAAVLFGSSSFTDIKIDTDFSVISILLTLIVVGWEELWFRGLFLNYCKQHLSEVHISVVIGLLFMLLHVLNPDINLLKTGPALFFAGAFLTLLYFRYKNIWLPVGVHFGNNYLGSIIETPTNDNLFYGSDGYLGAILLAVLWLYLVLKNRNQKYVIAP